MADKPQILSRADITDFATNPLCLLSPPPSVIVCRYSVYLHCFLSCPPIVTVSRLACLVPLYPVSPFLLLWLSVRLSVYLQCFLSRSPTVAVCTPVCLSISIVSCLPLLLLCLSERLSIPYITPMSGNTNTVNAGRYSPPLTSFIISPILLDIFTLFNVFYISCTSV